MQLLIEQHIPYAHAIAAEVLAKYPTADRRDLQSLAELGLVQAAKDFDASRGVSFTTFAYYRIRGAIYDDLRRTCRTNKFEVAANDYMTRCLSNASAVTGKCEVGRELEEITSDLVTTYILSLETPPYRCAASEWESPAGRLLLRERTARVRRTLQQLPERYRVVLTAYYYRDLTFKEIGRELGLSESWVSRIHAKGIKLMCKAMQRDDQLAKARTSHDSKHRAFPLKNSKSYGPQPITERQRHGYHNNQHFSSAG